MKITTSTKLILFFLIFLFGIAQNTFAHTLSLPDNKVIAYTDTGGNGTPLVLIHAFPTDGRLWTPQQEGLKKQFRVITIDLWGFGQSSAVDGKAITMTEYANEVKTLLDHLNIRKAIIGGESMGGYITLAFLQKYPTKTQGLVLSNTQSIADNAETKIKREATAKDVLDNGTAQLTNGLLSKILSEETPIKTKQFLQTIFESQSATAVASALRGMAIRQDMSPVLSKTTLPVLIITSKNDSVISPKLSQEMHQLAKNSKLVTLEHSGHLTSLEQPTEWNQAIIDMFSNA